MHQLEQPRLTGARASATMLCDALPEDCSASSVHLDASGMDASSQSFADQLISEVFDRRGAASLTVHRPTDRYAAHLEDAANRHSFPDRLTIHKRH